MTYIEQLKKLNDQKSRISNLLKDIDRKKCELLKKIGNELYGRPGDMIVITDNNGIQHQVKIMFVDESLFSDLPRCIVKMNGNLISIGPEKIVKKL